MNTINEQNQIIYDYTLPDNNCFIVKHSNKYFDDYVESLCIDFKNNLIIINYHDVNKIPVEKEVVLETYTRFGILQDTKIFLIQDVIDKTKSSITYLYQVKQ